MAAILDLSVTTTTVLPFGACYVIMHKVYSFATLEKSNRFCSYVVGMQYSHMINLCWFMSAHNQVSTFPATENDLSPVPLLAGLTRSNLQITNPHL